ncbi:Abi family protein [Janibacter limosus]|uniref:Abi family protein n=1 Tax=Janibacter limosus TaxID=53458 RepID=A0A4P6MXI1_9MICO|nr:Abi family protein [Janibacter limosus]QBF47799.1 Abi family protein [Janibacter limosus]
MAQPVKPFTSISDQVDILRRRGMSLDRDEAARWLEVVGYYRLSGYWYPYRTISSAVRGDHFVPGATFDDVVRLYEFDRKLRTQIHDGIERIEVALRSRVSYLIAEHDPLAYQDAKLFRPTFNHSEWLKTASRRVDRAKRHSEPIRHYEKKYGGRVPIWVLTEVLDFSDVSKLYDGMLARDQWTVAERLGVRIDETRLSGNQRKRALKVHPLARWLEHLSVLRNSAAHHGRVWNRSFTPVGTAALRSIEGLECLPEGQSERVFGALTLMGHLLQQTSPGTTWTDKVRSLVDGTFRALPARSVAEMGFPEGWQGAPLWAPGSP